MDESLSQQPVAEDMNWVTTSESSPQVVDALQPWWRRATKWVVVGNPFYPLSAVLVLLGIFLLSGEERLFGAEVHQLIFNFSAVGAYGVLIVVTAVFLFQRSIHYDTLMLVVVVTLPILVPFVLISQAAFLDSSLMIWLCLVAAALGLAQFGFLRFKIPDLPLGGGLGVFFVLVLAVNLVMPVITFELHARLAAIPWAIGLDQYGPLAWHLIVPGLITVGFFVAPARQRVFGDCRSGWLPLTWMLLLIGGTGVQIASLGFVYSFPMQLGHVYPSLWLAAWLIVSRRGDWTTNCDSTASRNLLAAPVLVGLVAWLDPGAATIDWLNLLNLAAYGALQCRHPSSRFITALLIASLASWLRTTPIGLVHGWFPETTRPDLFLLVASLLIFAAGSWRRTPIWGVLCALAVIHPLKFFWFTSSGESAVVLQFAMLMCWFHSFRWKLVDRLTVRLRILCFAIWWIHGLGWYLHNGGVGTNGLISFAGIFALSSSLQAWLGHHPREWIFAGLALLVAGFRGAPDIAETSRNMPIGLVVLLAGLLSFGCGTLAAVWRKRLSEHLTRLGS